MELRKEILSLGDEIFPRSKEDFFQEMMLSLVWEGSRALRLGWSVISSREVLPTREDPHAESLCRGRRGDEAVWGGGCCRGRGVGSRGQDL